MKISPKPPKAEVPTCGPTPTPGHAFPPVLPLDPAPFRRALSSWYREHARELPWRGIRDPYATWLSEIMLQQTRVATVLDRYIEFLQRFPTVAALAAAPEDDVLALWSGLGYYRRARMLHRGAQFVVRELNGRLPQTATGLRTLPGVGEYTAAAIASIAFGQPVAVLDGNVERVLLRVLGLPEAKGAAAHTLLLRAADALVPPAAPRRSRRNPPGDHNQAIMELGATLCLPRAPLCLHCPVLSFCHTRGEHPTPARKQLLSCRIACLLATRKRGTRTEILLHRRPATASLMPGMLDLPPLPLQAIAHREPILRLRHSITNTNYYVEVFAEPAPGATPHPEAQQDASAPENSRAGLFCAAQGAHELRDSADDEEAVYVAAPEELTRSFTLVAQIPANPADLRWLPASGLDAHPLTGLARKVLQRLGLMNTGKVRVGPDRSV